ncbi:MAG: hypothetical protein IJL85_07585 [Erysipelotrichaceae bacterium]|nr:hypothetical protein [Erysipelotrichaceae bacterium]
MKRGDTVYYIENWEIKEAEILNFSNGFVTVRYHSLCPELLGGQSMYLNRGIRLRFSKIYSNKDQAQNALDRYRKTWR